MTIDRGNMTFYGIVAEYPTLAEEATARTGWPLKNTHRSFT